MKKDIHETTVYPEAFILNLLLGENNELKNRYLHIYHSFKNTAIEARIAGFNAQTRKNILELYSKFKTEVIFGRSNISDVCGISYSTAGNLIVKMKKCELVEEVNGHGKGKYRFSADVKSEILS